MLGPFRGLIASVLMAAPIAVAVPPSPLCVEPVLPCPKPQPAPRPAPDRLVAYRGLGTWVDAYDFSRELGGRLTPSAVDTMASQGVRTLYLQAAKDDARVKGDLLSPDLLGQWLERAHGKGIYVVAWYLPKFTNPEKDWRHLKATLDFRYKGHAFDAIGLDIEARDVKDPKVRSDRLVALSKRLRDGTRLPTSAIVVPPVVLAKINPAFWPDFPWKQIKPYYEAWIPMGYYTYRTPQSGYRDAYRYSKDNIDLLRRDVGDSKAAVHIAGGIGDKSTRQDYEGLVKAAYDGAAIGASSYDYATTHGSAWVTLRGAPGNGAPRRS